MIKFLTLAVTLMALLMAGESVVLARGMGGGPGASNFAPGHETRVPGTHGASANAPGRLFLRSGRPCLAGHPGASGFAPGHCFRHR
jgi:hypothetical protein